MSVNDSLPKVRTIGGLFLYIDGSPGVPMTVVLKAWAEGYRRRIRNVDRYRPYVLARRVR